VNIRGTTPIGNVAGDGGGNFSHCCFAEWKYSGFDLLFFDLNEKECI
jgi:hypothetical protein